MKKYHAEKDITPPFYDKYDKESQYLVISMLLPVRLALLKIAETSPAPHTQKQILRILKHMDPDDSDIISYLLIHILVFKRDPFFVPEVRKKIILILQKYKISDPDIPYIIAQAAQYDNDPLVQQTAIKFLESNQQENSPFN